MQGGGCTVNGGALPFKLRVKASEVVTLGLKFPRWDS